MKAQKLIGNLLFVLIFALFAYRQIPVVINNYRAQGIDLGPIQAHNLETKQDVQILDSEKNYVVIFWATWCAPCKVEMSRLRRSVDQGKIPKENILAVNLGESYTAINRYLLENKFPFTFVDDKGVLVKKFQVNSTPTVVLIEKGKTTSVSSGISFIGIFRAENMF